MTKINVNTSELNRDVLPFFKDAIDHLNKSLELTSQITPPQDYQYLKEYLEFNKKMEKVRDLLRDYYNAYSNASNHFENLNEDLLQQINKIKNINIFKK